MRAIDITLQIFVCEGEREKDFESNRFRMHCVCAREKKESKRNFG